MIKKIDVNYLKMLQDIDEIVNTDFTEDMNMKANITYSGTHRLISQDDARKMANIIGSVYLISHAIHCENCGSKYKKTL